MVFGNGIHLLISGRAQSIFWNISSSLQLLFNFEKRKTVTGRHMSGEFYREGRMGQNMNLFFFQKLYHNLGFLYWGFAMNKTNVANSRLGSLPVVIFLNFLQHIIFVNMSGDWSAFWKSNLNYRTFNIKENRMWYFFVLWHRFAITGRCAFLINHILL